MGASTKVEFAFSLTSAATSRDVVGSMVEVSMKRREDSVGGLGRVVVRMESKTERTCFGSGRAVMM
jgi:hypothetical protein